MASYEFVTNLSKGDLLKIKSGDYGWFVAKFDRVISHSTISVYYTSAPDVAKIIETSRVISKFSENENKLQNQTTSVGDFTISRTDRLHDRGDKVKSSKRHLSYKTRCYKTEGKLRMSENNISSEC